MLILNAGGFQIRPSVNPINRIVNAYTQHGRIANPPERTYWAHGISQIRILDKKGRSSVDMTVGQLQIGQSNCELKTTDFSDIK